MCRQWGNDDFIDVGERHHVTRITGEPGARSNVQVHHHVAEHWVAVSGTATVTNGEKMFLLPENGSTYIPVEVVHALENQGKFDLELIEVQAGTYREEGGIVRFSHRYRR